RNYEQLFTKKNPEEVEEGQTFIDNLNQDSESIITAFGEPELGKATVGEHFQFERKGYYAVDPDTQSDQLVLNCTVGLRDSWRKKQKK
ncbi:MAG TPA: glutamine--tRNA ligase, partial [Opitutae bacterium]|nr:glutamine--tRNA ligase [Opitutae bacterium]